MPTTTADILVDRLIDWGVRVVFGLPGDGINGIMEALRTRQERITFVQVRHEEAAAFMATGYAKYTGQPLVMAPAIVAFSADVSSCSPSPAAR